MIYDDVIHDIQYAQTGLEHGCKILCVFVRAMKESKQADCSWLRRHKQAYRQFLS